MKSSGVTRLRIIGICISIFVVLLIGKLYTLQIVSGDNFRLRAERQYVHTNDTIYDRGSIFFSNKDETIVAAATLKVGFTITLNPRLITNVNDAYKKINDILPIDEKTFLTKATQAGTQYVILAKKIDETTAKKIQTLKIGGVSVYKDRYRYYPSKSVASTEIGLTGYKGDILAGRYGLESYYENVLNRDQDTLYTNFFAEIFSGLKKTVDQKSKFEGDLVTTIEPTVQAFLEKQLQGVQDTWHSKATGAIIMNPQNGEIYAMAIKPDFDANNPQNEKSPAVFSNPMVEHVYEMGSIIKPITMASGIDSKTVTPETTYDDKGFMIINGSRINNFDGKGRGVVPMQTVLNDSLNTGVAFVANKMGNDLFSSYFRKFGLGDETGIDLPNETPGLIDNLKSPREIEHATASYGQGIAMSPIITVRALAALGNGGHLVVPHFVKRIDYKIGVSKKINYTNSAPIISADTSKQISTMLVTVVDKALLGGTVKMPHYSIAAKTGTAQIAKEGGGGYYSDRYLHSFFGYFPAYNPQFIIFLYTIEPQGASFASHTLTMPFIDTTKFLINYYKIPPDR